MSKEEKKKLKLEQKKKDKIHGALLITFVLLLTVICNVM